MSRLQTIIEYFEAPASSSFTLPPTAAISYFKAKGLKATFDWRDMLGAEHANAFTVAKMADLDMLADVQAALDAALTNGTSFTTFADSIIPTLQAKGWWGRKAVTDPLTGETIVAQLGSPGRLKTIFRTNVQSAYAVGHWEQIAANVDTAPYLLYDAVDDHRTRPQHKAWDGTVLPVTDHFWKAHFPPNGWNCRCGVVQLSEQDMEDLGMSVTPAPAGGSYEWTNPRTGKTLKVPKGLDPGWDVNQGEIRLQALQKLAAEKIKAMKPKAATAAAKGLKKAEADAKAAAIDAGIATAPAMDATAASLAKGAGKAQTRAAEQAIAKALKENTPYLGKAIQKIQASKAGTTMSPIELLDAAKAEAVKVKDAAALANWKAAQIAGKQGTPAGKAVFDALPDAAKASILDDIAAKNGAKAAAEAIETELVSIANGDLGPVAKANLLEIKAANPDITSAELLAKVNAMPNKLTAGQQAGGIAGWYKNAVAGKAPTPKQQLAFDSLTEKQKAYQLDKVDKAKAAKNAQAVAPVPVPDPVPAPVPTPAAPKAPKAKPAATSAPDASQTLWAGEYKHSNMHYPDDPQGLTKEILIDKYGFPDEFEDPISIQDIEDFAHALDADLEDFKKSIHWEMPYTPGPKQSSTPMFGPSLVSDAVPDFNPSSLKQIGPQKGSNPGGTYVDEVTGTEWYVKFPASTDNAANEVLAAKLYEAAGIEVPDIRLTTIDGKAAVASRIEAGLKRGTAKKLKDAGGTDGFVVDAWLANWDVAGATMDNMLMRGVRAFRVDTGGALRYRAQGTLKGSAWGNEVPELESLRNAKSAPQASKIFGDMTKAQIEEAAKRVTRISDKTIDDLVNTFGPSSAADKKELAATLKARRDFIASKYPNKVKPVPKEKSTARVTALEQSEIEASRVNGYTIPTDGDQIDQQQVVFSVIKDASGKDVTRVFLKVRDSGAAAIKKTFPTATMDAPKKLIDMGDIRQQYTAVLKSINFRASKGEALGSVPMTKYMNLKAMWDAKVAEINSSEVISKADAQAMIRANEADFQEAFNFIQAHTVTAPKTTFKTIDIENVMPDIKLNPTPAKPDDAVKLPWVKKDEFTYPIAEFDKSRAKLTGNHSNISGMDDVMALQVGTTEIRYITDTAQNLISGRGTIMIDIKGSGTMATEEAFKVLEKIGLNSARAGELERLELYLDNIAHIRTLESPALEDNYKKAQKTADIKARTDEKLAMLNIDAGFDMRTSRFWNPEGEHQAFGHGRTITYRPDIPDAETDAFAKDAVVYHNTSSLGVGGSPQWDRLKHIIEGGGQFGSQIDRIRRGVESTGSSVGSDHRTGGANYIFTRLKKRAGQIKSYKKAGVYWNPKKMIRRTDAVTLTKDMFGTVSREQHKKFRKIDPSGWEQAMTGGGNETNFRDSLSLFDDVEKIVLFGKAEYDEALRDMRAMGYTTWPDGRKLEEVFGYEP